MNAETFAVIGIVIALFSICVAVLTVRRTKTQILEMSDILEDIKNGNGNRRILAETHELTAPLAYSINDIVRSYEDRLLALRRAEETAFPTMSGRRLPH